MVEFSYWGKTVWQVTRSLNDIAKPHWQLCFVSEGGGVKECDYILTPQGQCMEKLKQPVNVLEMFVKW